MIWFSLIPITTGMLNIYCTAFELKRIHVYSPSKCRLTSVYLQCYYITPSWHYIRIAYILPFWRYIRSIAYIPPSEWTSYLFDLPPLNPYYLHVYLDNLLSPHVISAAPRHIK